MNSKFAMTIATLSCATASTAGEQQSIPNAQNAGAFRDVLLTKQVDVHVLSDSIGLPLENRYTTYVAWIIESVTGELPTRIGSGAGHFGTRRRFGMGISASVSPGFDEISAQQIDPYLLTGGRAPLVLGGQGSAFPHDGSRSYGLMNGQFGTVLSILANSTPTNGLTTGGALTNVLLPGQNNRVLIDLYVQAGSEGLPDRNFIVQDFNRNGPVVAMFNPSKDIAGYSHLDEPNNTPRLAVVEGQIGRVLPAFDITGQLSSNENLRAVVSDLERSINLDNSPIDDGSALNVVGMSMSRADDSGNWVGGTALFHHGGISWDIDGWAEDAPPTAIMPKRFSDEHWLHAMDAWTHDVSRRSLYVLCIAAESGLSAEQVRMFCESIMDRMTAIDLAIGKPLPFFALVQWHRQGGLSEQQQRSWFEGYHLAAMGRANAASINVAGMLDYVVFDGSLEAQDYLANQDLSTFSFGNVVDGDVSDANLVPDGTHQSTEVANAFFAMHVAQALQSASCPGSGSVDFDDLVAMLFEFGPGQSACDADGTGHVDFNDLVAALFLFGPCPGV